MTLSFAVTWDYRCPFARTAHEHEEFVGEFKHTTISR
jgi:hypothetical protein